MGVFTVGCLIKNHVDRERLVKIPRLMVDTGSEPTCLGSATVPVAAWCVSHHASLLGAFYESIFGWMACRTVAFKKHGGDVFGGTPNTAGETPALPSELQTIEQFY